jgi:hypothetical protein
VTEVLTDQAGWRQYIRLIASFRSFSLRARFPRRPLCVAGIRFGRPKWRRRCKYPINGFLGGDAFVLLIMAASIFILRAANKRNRGKMIRPCIIWLLLLFAVHSGVFVTGFIWLAAMRRGQCPTRMVSAGWFFQFLIFVTSLVILILGCCRRTKQEKDSQAMLMALVTGAQVVPENKAMAKMDDLEKGLESKVHEPSSP